MNIDRLVYQQVDYRIQTRSIFDGRRNIYTNRQLPNFIMNISNVNVTIPGINVSRSFNVRINKVLKLICENFVDALTGNLLYQQVF